MVLIKWNKLRHEQLDGNDQISFSLRLQIVLLLTVYIIHLNKRQFSITERN